MGYFSSIHFTRLHARAVSLLLFGLCCPPVAWAQNTGMIVDGGIARIFDMSTDTVKDFVTYPVGPPQPNGPQGDCSMSEDETTAWITNGSGEVYEVDLTADPPTLEATPIAISFPGYDTALTPGGEFLVVTSYGAASPLAVVDIANPVSVNSFSLSQTSHTSVDVCADGSMLVTTAYPSSSVFLGSIDGTGAISPVAGPLLGAGGWNVYCSPSTQTGVAVNAIPSSISSFQIPSLSLVETVPTVGTGAQSAVLNAAGTMIFVATDTTVEAYTYNQGTGDIGGSGNSFTWKTLLARPVNTVYGIDKIMLSPDETKLYVSGVSGSVRILNASTGAIQTDPIVGPSSSTGLCRAAVAVDGDSDSDGINDSADLCPNTVADVPTKALGPNRWIWYGAEWVTESKGGGDADDAFTMAETHGCGCTQILDRLVEKTGQDFNGHYKMGCSSGVVEDWIEGYYHMETVVVPADDADGVESATMLMSGVDYQLAANGVASALDDPAVLFDARYSVTEPPEDPEVPEDWTDTVTGSGNDDASLLDLHVNGSDVNWGPFNTDHLYLYDLSGDGNPLQLWINDSDYLDNTGYLTVDIFVDLW